MSYRPRPEFDQPTAESVQRSRRTVVWVIPLMIIQQGTAIFRHGADISVQVMGTLAWAAVTFTLLWMLFGLPMRWLSERDQAILNDEWNREISGDAARWGIGALAAIGCGLMLARIWEPLDAGLAIYVLVNGALVVAVLRYAWLNRAEPGEDE
jgi:hypothetical protein